MMPFRAGSMSTTYLDGAVVVKVPRLPSANMLMAAERAALTDLASLTGEHTWLAPYFPRLTGTATVQDPSSGARREINALAALVDGYLTLAEVAAHYPDGLDPRDYAWMHRRLLRSIAGAHLAGWVHGAIFADNVLIHPELHGVVLIGWSYATPPGVPLAATIPGRDYPPEVRAGEATSYESDVYLAHALLLDVLGSRIPAPIRSFARGCMQDRPTARPSAVELLDEYDELLDRLYGERRFRPFQIPTRTTKGQ